jgi:hypothetical protein
MAHPQTKPGALNEVDIPSLLGGILALSAEAMIMAGLMVIAGIVAVGSIVWWLVARVSIPTRSTKAAIESS